MCRLYRCHVLMLDNGTGEKINPSQLAECLLYLIPSAKACVNHSALQALDTWTISYLAFGNILVIPWSFHRLKSHSQWGQSSPVCDPVCAWPPGSTATWSAASSSERQGVGITDHCQCQGQGNDCKSLLSSWFRDIFSSPASSRAPL